MPPWTPAPPGSGTSGPALAPWLSVLSALAVHSRRIRAHGWETVSDARRPCPNPDPSAPPATFPHPSTLAPLPRDPGDRLVCLHQANGPGFHQMREKGKTGTNSAPFPGEAVGGGEGAGEGGEGRGLGRREKLLARRSLEVGGLLLVPCKALHLHTLCFLPSMSKYCFRCLS